MSDPTLLTMLVPGSVWYREASGKQSLVLFVTNQTLRGKVADKNPSQVVFLTEEHNVLSQGVEQFLSSRTYFTMDPNMEAMLQLILSTEDEEDEAEQEEETVESATAGIDALAQENAEDAGPMFDSGSMLSLNVGPHEHAELLQRNLVAYSEAPFYTGDTQHKLVFTLTDGLTLEKIRAAFFIKDPNAIQKFVLTTPYEATMVDIDSYVDTLLEADEYHQYGSVFLVSAGDFRAVEEPIEDISFTEVAQPQPIQITPFVSNPADMSHPQQFQVGPDGLLIGGVTDATLASASSVANIPGVSPLQVNRI